MTAARSKSIFDYKHVRSVNAWALVHDGNHAGKVVANWSDNPAGSVCTVCVIIWIGTLCDKGERFDAKGKAGGGGYCKFSAAFESAMRDQGCKGVHGAGEREVEKWLESKGYEVFRVI